MRDVSNFLRPNFTILNVRVYHRRGRPLLTATIGPVIPPYLRKMGDKVLLFTYRKSHTGFPLVPNLMTLNDLE